MSEIKDTMILAVRREDYNKLRSELAAKDEIIASQNQNNANLLMELGRKDATIQAAREAFEADKICQDFDCPHEPEQLCKCGLIQTEIYKKYWDARDKALGLMGDKE